jgi:hypothetical protein
MIFPCPPRSPPDGALGTPVSQWSLFTATLALRTIHRTKADGGLSYDLCSRPKSENTNSRYSVGNFITNAYLKGLRSRSAHYLSEATLL